MKRPSAFGKHATVLCAVAIGSAALAQSDGQTNTALEPGVAVDAEVVVRGRSRAALRIQIELAEEAVYERFNEINSKDEFDIHCRFQLLTGSKIPRRICQPNFRRAAEAQAAQETVHRLQGGFALPAAMFQAEALYKHDLLAEEMRRLAIEDDELSRALARLANLTQARAEGRALPVPQTSAARIATAEEESLPYDASLRADVLIGREPWSHVLTQQTFTIANVFGKIEALEVECRERTARLPYEPGAEWTVPDDWGTCSVFVDAAPRTTFSLFEFE